MHVALHLLPFGRRADAAVPVRSGVSAVVDVAPVQQRLILAVGHDHLAERLRAQHGAFHHLIRLHALAVVGEGEGVLCHALEIGERLALFAHGDRGVGEDTDHGVVADALQLGI